MFRKVKWSSFLRIFLQGGRVMTNFYGVSSYQQVDQDYKEIKKSQDNIKLNKDETAKSATADSAAAEKIAAKPYQPITPSSSLAPVKTQYGNTIGDVNLSEKAQAYYDKLKAKFGNMDFILVSKDMKSSVAQNAASYGNANRMVVLIDEEKLERMATDESYAKKYEGIIAMSQNKLSEAKNSLVSSGASVNNFGMSVSENGTVKYFATLEKSNQLQKQRLENKQQEKKEEKIKENRKAQKEAFDKRIENSREDNKSEGINEKGHNTNEVEDKEYVMIEADTMEDLFTKLQMYSYNNATSHVLSQEERLIGSFIDFKG